MDMEKSFVRGGVALAILIIILVAISTIEYFSPNAFLNNSISEIDGYDFNQVHAPLGFVPYDPNKHEPRITEVTVPDFDKTDWSLYQDQNLGVQFQIPNNYTEKYPGEFRWAQDKNKTIDFSTDPNFGEKDERAIINGISWSVARSRSEPIWINYHLDVLDHEYPSINFSSSDEQLLQQVLSTFKIAAKSPIVVSDFDKTDWKLYQDKDLGVEFLIPSNLTDYSHGTFRTSKHQAEYELVVKNCAGAKNPNGEIDVGYCVQETPHLNPDLTFGTFSIYSGRGDWSRARVIINGVAWLKADFVEDKSGNRKPQVNYQLEQRVDNAQAFEFTAMDEQMLLKVLSTFKITSRPTVVD